MAQYTADIILKVISTKAEEAVKRLTQQVDRLNDTVKGVEYDQAFGKISTSASKARQSINKLAQSVEKFGSLGAAAGVGGVAVAINEVARAAAGATASLNPFINAWNAAGAAVHNVTGFLDPLNAALSGLSPSAQAAAAGIGITATALMAFAPQLQDIAAFTGETTKKLNNLRKTAEGKILGSIDEEFRLTKQAIQTLDTSASGLRKTISELTKEQQRLYADSSEYRNKTVEILNAEELLTTELKQQAQVLKELNLLRTGSAFKEAGLGDIFEPKQKLLPAFEERGLQQLNTGYAEALRLTQERAAATRTALNVEEALASELTRGTRYAEKTAEAAKRLRDYNGKVLTTSQGTSQAMSVSAQVANSWQAALQKGYRWQELSAAESDKFLKSNKATLSVYNAQIEAQKQLVELDKQRAEAQKQQNKLAEANAKRLESLALGVGFPLLFGAGPGSVLGSLAGSFAGKGFGGQIFGGAIGQVVDDVVASVAELGQALNPLSFNLDAVTTAAGLSGTELEQYINTLEESGDAAGAAAAAQEALASVVGYDGVDALDTFGEATLRLGNAFNRAMATMAAGVASIINSLPGFLQFTQNLENNALLNRALTSQDPTQLENQRQLEAARVGTGGVDIAKQQAAIQKLISNQRALEAGGSAEALEINKRKLAVAQQELAVTRAGSDLTNDAVFAAELELLKRRDALEITELYNRKMTDAARNQEAELLYAQQTNREQELRLKRQQAIDKASESAAKRAETEAARTTREREQSLKTGQRLIDQLELQVLKLDDVDKTTLAIREAEFRRAQTQESINQLVDEEQRRVATTLNLERERLAIQDAYAKGAERIFKLNEQFYSSGNTAKLQELTTVGQAVVQVAEGIGSAFKNSFDAILTGTQTAQEAIANFFKEIGNALIQYATTAIAQYIAIGIARLFAGVGTTSVSGTDFGSMDISQFSGGFGVDTTGLAGPSSPLSNPLSYAGVQFAKGGYVTGPTNALIGEGGEPEYVIPASKMRGAMARYSSGQRGSSVVNGAATAGGGGSQVIRFESTVINNVEYVTRSQAEAMSRQAAKQGAAGGYAKTMGGLRNSRATRARVGMG